MKTNVTLTSSDRNLFGTIIRQQTQTGFLNLSDLQEAYTRARVLNNWTDRKVQDMFTYKPNIERMFYLLQDRGLVNSTLLEFMEDAEKDGTIKTLKKLGVYKTTGRGENKTTYCDPYIWVLIAMELNPQLYAKVVKWLTDKLLINRIEAGKMYRGLTNAMKSKFPNPDYAGVAKMLNQVIFRRHETGIRNFATQEELKQLEDLEKFCAGLIDMEFIKTQEKLKEHLQEIYIKNHQLEYN